MWLSQPADFPILPPSVNDQRSDSCCPALPAEEALVMVDTAASIAPAPFSPA